MSKNENYERICLQAHKAFQERQYLEAIQLWRKAIKIEKTPELQKKMAQAHFRYALSLDRQKNQPEIITTLFQCLQFDPDMAMVHYHIALLYHKQKKYDKALGAYEKALKLSPGNPRFLKHLKLLQIEMNQTLLPEEKNVEHEIEQKIQAGQYKEAWNLLQESKDGMQTEDFNLYSAFLLTMQKEYTKAKKIWKELLASRHKAIASYYSGLISIQEKKWPSAIKSLEVAMQSKMLEEEARKALLSVYEYQAFKLPAKEEKKAKLICNKIAAIDPNHELAHNSIAITLEQGYQYAIEEKYGQAIKIWSRLVDSGNNHPLLLQNCAIAYDKKGGNYQALQYWNRLAKIWENALDKDPNRELTQKKLALVYLRIGEIHNHLRNYRQEILAYEKALEFTPDDVDLHLRLVEIDCAEDDYVSALNKLKKLCQQFPKNKKILEATGKCYAQSGNFFKASEYAIEIATLFPDDKEIWDILRYAGIHAAKECMEKRNIVQAQGLLQKLIQVDKSYMPYHGFLWQILLDIGRKEEARQEIEKLAATLPNKAQVFAEAAKIYSLKNLPERLEYLKKAKELVKENDIEARGAIYTASILENKANTIKELKHLILKEEEKALIFKRLIESLEHSGKISLAMDVIQECGMLFSNSLELGMKILSGAIANGDLVLAEKAAPVLCDLAREKKEFDIVASLQMLMRMMRSPFNLMGNPFFSPDFMDDFGDDDDEEYEY